MPNNVDKVLKVLKKIGPNTRHMGYIGVAMVTVDDDDINRVFDNKERIKLIDDIVLMFDNIPISDAIIMIHEVYDMIMSAAITAMLDRDEDLDEETIIKEFIKVAIHAQNKVSMSMVEEIDRVMSEYNKGDYEDMYL